MSEAAQLMQYDANKKSAVVAYLLWFFIGMLGAHRFYLGLPGSGATILIITILSLLLLVTGVGAVTILISVIWVLVDLFLIPGITREHNVALARELSGGARQGSVSLHE
jgi:TM2 domain-containing membrane protein YozV